VKPINNKPVILFDGVCNLCNSAVQFVIRRDTSSRFLFASLQSGFAQALLKDRGVDAAASDTIFLYEDGRLYRRSEAVVRIASQLRGVKWMSVFRIIPLFVRDSVYRVLSRNRYSIFGKRDTCMIPTEDLKHRFLDDVDSSSFTSGKSTA
jgi:predicted DCC family thiol-disulfide oxidoreductase YuxK